MHQYTPQDIYILLDQLDTPSLREGDTIIIPLHNSAEDLALEPDPDDGLYYLDRPLATYVCPDAIA